MTTNFSDKENEESLPVWKKCFDSTILNLGFQVSLFYNYKHDVC